jgi:hypothetical protein
VDLVGLLRPGHMPGQMKHHVRGNRLEEAANGDWIGQIRSRPRQSAVPLWVGGA